MKSIHLFLLASGLAAGAVAAEPRHLYCLTRVQNAQTYQFTEKLWQKDFRVGAVPRDPNDLVHGEFRVNVYATLSDGFGPDGVRLSVAYLAGGLKHESSAGNSGYFFAQANRFGRYAEPLESVSATNPETGNTLSLHCSINGPLRLSGPVGGTTPPKP